MKNVAQGYMVCGIAGLNDYIALKLLKSLQAKLPLKTVVTTLAY